jgi:MoaA/NifB/PqqE/SkfB family radical SAM enzyme
MDEDRTSSFDTIIVVVQQRFQDEKVDMNPPRFLFVHLSETCNLKCPHCLYWQNVSHDTSDNFPLDSKLAVLREFASMNPRGVVVTCGAESTMELEGFYRFTGECRRLGLRSVSVSNGVVISTPEKARRMLFKGPTELSISLDSHTEELHDEFRGVKGSFKAAVRAIKLLLTARHQSRAYEQRIHAMLLLCKDNYESLEQIYEFALCQLGVDKLKLNLLQPTFGCSSGHDKFFVEHSTMDADKLMEILRHCDERFCLKMNPEWISQVGGYVRAVANSPLEGRGWSHPIETPEHICNSYERNLVIDMKGIVRLCVSERFPGVQWHQPGDLKTFWETSDRATMKTCNQLCGITHSMRRLSTTFAGLTHFD